MMSTNIKLSSVASTSAWIFLGFLVTMPFFVSAETLVPCGTTTGDMCTFDDLITIANNVINFLLYSVCVPLAALGFAYVGGKLVINRDKEKAWSEAKEAFGNIILGFVIIVAAFVLVKSFLFVFLNSDAGFTTFLFE